MSGASEPLVPSPLYTGERVRVRGFGETMKAEG
jgi:hypothetical protein